MPRLTHLLSIAAAAWLGAAQPARPAEPTTPRYRIGYATYFGGDQWDEAREVIVCPDGSVLVGGMTASAGLPMPADAAQPKYAGDDPALGHGGIYGGDCFLLRLSADGRKVLAGTYFGGSKQERAVYGMALDSKGNVVIASATRSPDLPTRPGCFQARYGGGTSDWMAAKLTADLKKVVWCTYVGGSGDESPRGGLAVDGRDNVYLVGTTASPDFPVSRGACQRRRRGKRDAAVVKLAPDGTAIAFSTLVGGSGSDGLMGVRVGAGGEVYAAGHTDSPDFPVTPGAAQARHGGKWDAHFVKLSPDGGRLLYATYLGGADNEWAEHRPFLTPGGEMLLAGVTLSPDFPATAGAFQRVRRGRSDGFLARLAPDGRRFGFVTLLGGSGSENLLMPVPDASGSIFVVGTSRSADLPVTADAVQKAYGGASGPWDGDGVLAALSADGAKLSYATYLGGRGGDLFRGLAFGPRGQVYLVGGTASADFPVTPGAVQTKYAGRTDAVIVKLVPAGAGRARPAGP